MEAYETVMAGPCPGHPRLPMCRQDVDARDKRGNDELLISFVLR
jgi:hypothetical protein